MAASVLIIDDEPGVGVLAALWLERRGNQCLMVRNAEEAKVLQEKHSFDAVFYASEFSFPGLAQPGQRAHGKGALARDSRGHTAGSLLARLRHLLATG